MRQSRRARTPRLLRVHARPRGGTDARRGAGRNGAGADGARRAARVPDVPEAARPSLPFARGTAARLHVEPQAEVRGGAGGGTRPRACTAFSGSRADARVTRARIRPWRCSTSTLLDLSFARPQPAAFFTSALILASSATVRVVSA